MLLKVIKTWPYLLLVPAVRRCTLIRFGPQAYSVNAFLVSLQIIGCSETLPSSLAIRYVTLERFFMLEYVFLEVRLALRYLVTLRTL